MLSLKVTYYALFCSYPWRLALPEQKQKRDEFKIETREEIGGRDWEERRKRKLMPAWKIK